MRRAHFAAIFGIALFAASCVATPSLAQNLQPTGLPVRGAVQGTDVIVDQPSGSSTVRGAQASAIATYVQSNLNLIGGLTGDCAATGPGTVAITCTKSSGTAFGTFAFQNFATLPSASGSPPISAGTVFPCIPSAALDGCTGTQLAAYVNNGPIGADPTGNADSTSALQSWLNAGAPGTILCGTYKTTATLTMELAANDGQQVRGSGAGSSSGGGACRTVIKPTSAVTTALIIDGTPTGGWVMEIGLQDIVFDMANMTDASTTSAIEQIQAFDVSYARVRVINDGSSKRGWLFKAGAYTTTLQNSQANIVDMEGTSSGNSVTTITLENADIGRLIGNYAYFVQVTGGAVQPTYDSTTMTPIYLAPGSAYIPSAVSGACASGCYAIPAVTFANGGSWTFATDIEQNGGFPSTYNDGTHGSLMAFPAVVIPSSMNRTTLIPSQLGGMYLVDFSGSTFAVGSNAGGGAPYNLIDAPTTFAGGLTIPSTASLTLAVAQTWPGVTLQPATDGTPFLIKSAGGTQYVNCSTYGGGGCSFLNKSALYGFYDGGSTQGWSLTMPSTGNGLLKLNNGSSATITLTGANGAIQATGGLYGTPVGASLASTVNATAYSINGTAGATCSGTPTASFATTLGIVTHC